jgi:hypothetical protein
MNGYLSLIKYYPDNRKEDNYSIGIILMMPNQNISKIKISDEIINKTNSAFGLKSSELIKAKLAGLNKRQISLPGLEYLAKYENGNIRFSKPIPTSIMNVDDDFEKLYGSYIDDKKEKKIRRNSLNYRKLAKRYRTSAAIRRKRKIWECKRVCVNGFETPHVVEP